MRTYLKKLLLTELLLIFICLGVQSQPNGRENVIFRFPSQSDSFTGGYNRNNTEMNRLRMLIDYHRIDIQRGIYFVYINGYCASFNNRDADSKMANARAERVKAELITIFRLPESAFRAQAQPGPFGHEYDVAVVYIQGGRYQSTTIPDNTWRQTYPSQVQSSPVQGRPQGQVQQTYPSQVQSPPVQSQTQQTYPQVKQPEPQKVTTQDVGTFEPVEEGFQYNIENSRKISLRTNVLYLLGLLPNIGVEYKPVEQIGILFNFGYSNWQSSDNGMRHILTLYNPEIRYYLGERRNWFVGGEFHAGEFDFKWDDFPSFKAKEGGKGNIGDLIGGGLTGGYRAFLSPTFDMDFSLGIGYTRLEYKPYTIVDGNIKYVNDDIIKVKEIFGPTHAGVSLIWKLGKKY